jgi:dihydroxy-acid dehydratase
MARRMAAVATLRPSAPRGYRKLFLQSVTQADQGVDFDFLQGKPNDPTP